MKWPQKFGQKTFGVTLLLDSFFAAFLLKEFKEFSEFKENNITH